jgi:cysteine-rich repeat protein
VEAGEECDDGDAAGGDGCAANCTLERLVSAPMMHQGTVQTSGYRIFLESQSQQTFRVGGATRAEGVRSCDGAVEFLAGEIPVAQRPEDLEFEPVPIPGVACACVRAAAAEHCAPALISSRPPSCDIGPECAGNPEVCGDPSLCLAAHGEGNASSGIIGCEGMEDVDYTRRASHLEGMDSCVRAGGPAPEGAAFLFTSASVGTILGTCDLDESNPDKGPDGIPCTDDDPESTRGVVSTSVQTTGDAGGAYVGVSTIQEGVVCGPMPCLTRAVGRPFSCGSLAGDPVLLGDFRLCSGIASSDSVTGEYVSTGCFEQSE